LLDTTEVSVLAVVGVSFAVRGTRNALAVLRERFPAMQLIALCIHDESVAVERVLASGASAIVLKPAARERLQRSHNEHCG
jgi:DNA-binding NarL/FixJ family response regulator